MFSNHRGVSNDFITQVRTELQESLVEGWEKFLESEELKIYQDFFLFLYRSGFDESRYRKLIPNPAYDQAAKLIGKPFLETATRLGINFDCLFPGDFKSSKEKLRNDCEARLFKLKAYHNRDFLCLFSLTFLHQHDRLEFPYPPELKIEDLDQTG